MPVEQACSPATSNTICSMSKLHISRVAEALEYLRSTRPQVFGADTHGFRLNPRLDETIVSAFERTHHVTLPSDFRAFLTHIGNGGAGPFYGVFPLGEVDDNFDLRVWREEEVGVLSEPFRFEEEWNDLSAKPPGDLAGRDESAYWKQIEAFERTYWSPALVNGAFPICHQGCALRILLVVTGHQAGYLWNDRRSEYAGLTPIRLVDGSPARFWDWYEEWLEGCLDNANGTRR